MLLADLFTNNQAIERLIEEQSFECLLEELGKVTEQ
jgi:hypothetical protein